MSLLEDIFLQDEAGEAQELERIIEGDEYDERPRDRSDSEENSEKEDEAEEDKRRVDPASTKTKRVVKNPRFILNPARLTGPRGIQIIPEHFKDFKFKGKGHEKEDLDMVLKKLEHWAYRLYPKFGFEDCLKKIETLGKKRPVMVHLHKIRSDQLVTEDAIVQKDSSDEETQQPPQEEDEFDKLLAQQIELAKNTPAPNSVKKPGFSTPAVDKRSPLLMPKATSSPSISEEQKERMMRNRKLAEERRLARLKASTVNETVDLTNTNVRSGMVTDDSVSFKHSETTGNITNGVRREITNEESDSVNLLDDEEPIGIHEEKRNKRNKLNVIDSSDEDDDMETQTVSVDIHKSKDVIDISEGYLSRAKIPESNEVIDLADIESSNRETERGQTRSILIDSLDKDSAEIVGETLTNDVVTDIDNHKIADIIDISEGTNNKSKPVSDNNEIVDLDVENEIQGTNQINTQLSVMVDSSDDECDIATISEAITVDVHHDSKQSASKNTEHSEKENITSSKKANDIDENKSPHTNEEESRTTVVKANNTEESTKNYLAEVHNHEKPNTVENTDTVEKDNDLEEIMDVDFSDDF